MFTKRNIPERQIYIKALSLKVPHNITLPFIDDVLKWESNSGIDWVVNRLKSIKQDLIDYYNVGKTPSTPWVAKTKDGLFKGNIGKLFQYSLQSDKCFDKVLSLLNIYTSYVFTQPRDSDRRKFQEAVNGQSEPVPSYYHEILARAATKFKVSTHPYKNTPFELELTTLNREERFMSEPRSFFKTTAGIRTFIKFGDILEQSMESFIPSRTRSKMSLLMGGKDRLPPYIGTICCTPNPGLKARFYAAPHLWLQHTLQPLGKEVYNLVNQLPWDCTFDQNKGDEIIQSHISQFRDAHCFDLTSATDRFPFELQLTTLRNLFSSIEMQHHIDYYEWMQTMPYEFFGEPITWSRGQALGMFPSFGTFTLTHGLLLYALNNFEHKDMFYVLGDDVIILDDDLARKYQLFLDECSIAYSPQKTIVSNHFAEFAGMMFHQTYKTRIPKWKPVNKQNVLDQIRTWGTDIITLVPKSKQPLLYRIAQLPYPYGCDINPKGLSLDERFSGLEEIFTPVEKDFGFSTNYRSLITRRFFEKRDLWFAYDPEKAYSNALNLDQRIQSYVDESNIPIPAEIAGKNLYSVNPELDLPISIQVGNNRNPRTEWSSTITRYINLV